jgi:hypothetical protein
MATSTLVRVPTDDAAAPIALALREKGINITEQFWMTPSEPRWKILGLVSPRRDAPDGYSLYRRIFSALEGFPYADPTFIGTGTMVFGENEIRKELDLIRSGYVRLTEIGPYEDVEIVPIPPASEIHQRLTLDFMPESSSVALCRIFYTSSSSYYGAVPSRIIESEPQLMVVLQSLQLPTSEQDRILKALRRGDGVETVVPDIRLDTLYHLKLV